MRSTRIVLALGGLLGVALACGAALGALPNGKIAGVPACPVFPASSPWNQRVETLPVAPGSARIVASIGLADNLHADFGSGLYEGRPIGIPITVVRGAQRKVRVAFEYADESDKGPYPIPANVAIEAGAPRTATGTRWSSTATGASSTSSSPSTRPPGTAGKPARARSSTSARTSSGQQAGRPPTRPASRSSPASRATRTWPAAGSTTRSASRFSGRAGLTSSRRATSRAT